LGTGTEPLRKIKNPLKFTRSDWMERALEIAVDIDGFAVDKNIATAMNLQK
jgi:hypothetical protein